MMGQHSGNQDRLFYAFNLDDHVPPEHLLRGIDRFLDLNDLRQHLTPFYSHTGRPSVDPELMIRMLIIGYSFGIRSERRLCEEVHLNLAYRWFCRLGLEDPVPDHSTFSKNRHGRFRESDAFRYVFEQVLARCIAEGLVGGEGFAVDASVVRADASRRRHRDTDDDDWGAGGGTRAVREYLAALDEAAPSSDQPVKKVSATDPSASFTAAPGGPAFYAYATNYLVDTEAGIIVDVEATPANRTKETNASQAMLARVEHRFAIKPKKLIGDTAYGIASMLGWLVDKQIEPHVPVWEKGERRDGTFSRSDFMFDLASDTYTCPGGKVLKRYRRAFKRERSGIQKDHTIKYRASERDCRACTLKAQCCPNAPARKVTRSVHEAARDVARRIKRTPEYWQSRRERKKVEVLFAHMKRVLRLDRLRLRGLSGANDEFLLAATAQNLRRMAKRFAQPPPNPSMAPA
jgi:transposase